jgi:hypothetical protein
MATRSVKKVATAATDVGGLKSSRYEKLQVSYGSIEASSYSLLDTIVFTDVPAQDIVRATIVAHDVSPVTLEVYPGTVGNAGPLTIGGISAPVKLSYVIEYVRGGGRVGPDAYTSNEYGSGQSLESGEGGLLTIVVGDIAGLTTTTVASLSTSQIAGLTTAQVVALRTDEARALTSSQVAAFTTKQIPALETRDFAVFTTSQLRAIETVDMQVLTSAELQALNTTQLDAFTSTQVAVLSTLQTAALNTAQLAALQ